MSARALLEELRDLGVVLEAEGGLLHVDAPAGVVTEELRTALVERKSKLLRLLKREQHRLEEVDQVGLVIRWAKEPGWIALRDPTDGAWHELKASGCLPGIVEAANTLRERVRNRCVR